MICRCEDVRADAIFAALAAGAATAREVRNVTRCGMGYCQGRTCGPLVQLVMKAARGSSMLQIGDFQKRPVVSPVTLEVVARSALPERPGEADRQDGEPCARAPK
ncbi:MAG: (2Fe-2S)-binding protein [Actinomycetota bacterium]|nr:(2Fe-2S)-binding protein [Actinomycetota bacterium]